MDVDDSELSSYFQRNLSEPSGSGEVEDEVGQEVKEEVKEEVFEEWPDWAWEEWGWQDEWPEQRDPLPPPVPPPSAPSRVTTPMPPPPPPPVPRGHEAARHEGWWRSTQSRWSAPSESNRGKGRGKAKGGKGKGKRTSNGGYYVRGGFVDASGEFHRRLDMWFWHVEALA